MNIGAMRLLKLLAGELTPQDEPIHSDGVGDPRRSFGDPTLDSLPPPRFSGGPEGASPPTDGLSPTEKSIPFGGPIVNPEEQRIRDLYTKEPQGMVDYRNYLANAPSHDKYEASTGRKIFAVLAGIGQELANHANKHGGGLNGLDVTNNIIDEPYNDAVKDWTLKGKGLGAIANLDEKRQYGQMKGEEAIQTNRRIQAQNDATKQSRQDSLDQRKAESDRKYELGMAKANTDKEKQLYKEQHDADTLALRKEAIEGGLKLREEGLQFRKDTSERIVQDPNDPNQNIIQNRLSGEEKGKAPLAGADRTKVSNAMEVKAGVDELKGLFTPEIRAKVGALKGRALEAWIENGFSDDPELTTFSRKLDTVQKKHSQIVGGSRSLAMIKDVRKNLRNIGQSEAGVDSTLNVLGDSADEAIGVRTPKKTPKFTEKKLSSGKIIQVEE